MTNLKLACDEVELMMDLAADEVSLVTKWILEALRFDGRSHGRDTPYPTVAGDAARTEM
jgi:hypothetical protein